MMVNPCFIRNELIFIRSHCFCPLGGGPPSFLTPWCFANHKLFSNYKHLLCYGASKRCFTKSYDWLFAFFENELVSSRF